MKNLKRILSLSILCATALSMQSCNNQTGSSNSTSESGTSSVADVWKVTFNLNYVGAPASTVADIAKGSKAVKPTDPTRTGYTFDGWFTNTETTDSFDFQTAITSDITLYAAWLDDSITYYTVTLNFNYDNLVKTYKVEENAKLVSPAIDERTGYVLDDWYSDSACTARAVWGMKVKADLSLYAKWLKATVMEAEYNPNLWNMQGPGFSGAASDKSMVVSDDKDYPMGASNGYYVSYLYSKGITFEFDFTSSIAVSDAVLIARWSAEMKDFTLTSDNYQVLVNNVAVQYDDIAFTDIPGMGAQQKHKFQDFSLSKISLLKGDNVIKLVTNNEIPMGATATGAAPLVDCLKISADDSATITYEEDHELTVGR